MLHPPPYALELSKGGIVRQHLRQDAHSFRAQAVAVDAMGEVGVEGGRERMRRKRRSKHTK